MIKSQTRRPTDSTLRNVRAANTRITKLEKRVAELERLVKAKQ